MPPLEVAAYPALLTAIWAVYRTGRGGATLNVSWFEWVRLATLSIFFGLILALQARFALVGLVASPITVAGAALAVAAVFGMLGIQLVEMVDGWRRRSGEAGAEPALG